MPKRERYESRKNLSDNIWLNPKCFSQNRQSAAKPRIAESSTTIPPEGSTRQAIGAWK